jgi:hypothetical protein
VLPTITKFQRKLQTRTPTNPNTPGDPKSSRSAFPTYPTQTQLGVSRAHIENRGANHYRPFGFDPVWFLWFCHSTFAWWMKSRRRNQIEVKARPRQGCGFRDDCVYLHVGDELSERNWAWMCPRAMDCWAGLPISLIGRVSPHTFVSILRYLTHERADKASSFLCLFASPLDTACITYPSVSSAE